MLFRSDELKKLIKEVVAEAADETEPVWKDTIYDNVKVVGIQNKSYERYEGTWALVVVYKEDLYEKVNNVLPTRGLYNKVTFNGAKRAIRLLELFSKLFISAAYDNNKTIMKLEEIKEKDNRIKEELKRKETVTRILEILEKDSEIERIMDDIISAIVDYLELSVITVAKVSESRGMIETFGEWYDESFIKDNTTANKLLLDVIPHYSGETLLIVEPDTEDADLQKILEKYNLKSMISVPIIVGKEPSIYAIFGESKYDRY